MTSRVTAAVERALDDRQRCATEEVERILAAAVRVMERVAPEPPRVSDIVAEAGSSNKAFYRYFAGKDDLHPGRHGTRRGDRGVLPRASNGQGDQAGGPDRPLDRRHPRTGRRPGPDQRDPGGRRTAVCRCRCRSRASGDEIMAPLRDLLTAPVTALGSKDVGRDADAIFNCTAATLRRYVGSAERPDTADIDHLVRFCLNGLGAARRRFR